MYATAYPGPNLELPLLEDPCPLLLSCAKTVGVTVGALVPLTPDEYLGKLENT